MPSRASWTKRWGRSDPRTPQPSNTTCRYVGSLSQPPHACHWAVYNACLTACLPRSSWRIPRSRRPAGRPATTQRGGCSSATRWGRHRLIILHSWTTDSPSLLQLTNIPRLKGASRVPSARCRRREMVADRHRQVFRSMIRFSGWFSINLVMKPLNQQAPP